MEKDPFNGKIKSYEIDRALLAIFVGSIIPFLLGVGLILFLIFGHNETTEIYILIISLSVLMFLTSISYAVFVPRIIRSYPKHKKIAHLLIKPELFYDGESTVFDVLYKIQKGSNIDFSINDTNVFIETISYIKSKKIRDYALDIKDKISVLQLATIAEEYMIKRKVEAFRALVNISDSEYEKELLTMAIHDYEIFGYLSDKVLDFYNVNDPRKENKPNVPFSEICPFPFFYKKGDIVKYLDGKKVKHAIIGSLRNESEICDFSDQCYLAYELGKNYDVENPLSVNHVHPHICDVNKINISSLDEKEKKNLELVKKIFLKEKINK